MKIEHSSFMIDFTFRNLLSFEMLYTYPTSTATASTLTQTHTNTSNEKQISKNEMKSISREAKQKKDIHAHADTADIESHDNKFPPKKKKISKNTGTDRTMSVCVRCARHRSMPFHFSVHFTYLFLSLFCELDSPSYISMCGLSLFASVCLLLYGAA